MIKPWNSAKRQPQTYPDGLALVFRAVNTAPNAARPAYKLQPAGTEALPFEERTAGVQRVSMLMQQGIRVSHVLRCPKRTDVSTNDRIKISGDSRVYKIGLIQYPADTVPESMDITVEEDETRYADEA